MGAVTVTNFARTEFGRRLELAYWINDVIGTDKFIFGNKGQDETWKYPLLEPKVAVNSADSAGTLLGNTADSAEPAPTLTLDNTLKLHRWIPYDELDTEQVLNLPSNYARRLGADVSTGRITRILTHMMHEAFGAGNRSKTNDLRTISTLGENTALTLEDISAEMTISGVPLAGRWCCLYPKLYNALARVESAMKTTMGGSAVVQHPQRQFLKFADFTILTSGAAFNLDYESSPAHVPYDSKYKKDNTQHSASPSHGQFLGTCWHEDSYAVRHTAAPITRISDSPAHESVLVTSRLHMGTVAVQTAGLWVLEDTEVSI